MKTQLPPVKEYVLCYAEPKDHPNWPEVLLIEKRKPLWQAGKYNLPGGSVEPGETCHQAARRELFEETNIDCRLSDIQFLGQIEVFDHASCIQVIVYVMHCRYDSLRGQNIPQSVTSERVFWLPLDDALHSTALIGNLRVIIPFCRAKLSCWVLQEDAYGDQQRVSFRDLEPEPLCERQAL